MGGAVYYGRDQRLATGLAGPANLDETAAIRLAMDSVYDVPFLAFQQTHPVSQLLSCRCSGAVTAQNCSIRSTQCVSGAAIGSAGPSATYRLTLTIVITGRNNASLRHTVRSRLSRKFFGPSELVVMLPR